MAWKKFGICTVQILFSFDIEIAWILILPWKEISTAHLQFSGLFNLFATDDILVRVEALLIF